MKRSEINNVVKSSTVFFTKNGWALPPDPKWDVTDFGLGNYKKSGLLLINLCEELEYCEKLMYATIGQETPLHYHKKKKEDIICRTGLLEIYLWKDNKIGIDETNSLTVKINGVERTIEAGEKVLLQAGERVTIVSGIWHKFLPASEECIIGEVSTANDDLNDNFFYNKAIGRFTAIDEDETPVVRLLSDKN
ncbi:MAG: D-lyxose/D-mannose family sugar isomerase [Chitinophagaceae bacterium]